MVVFIKIHALCPFIFICVHEWLYLLEYMFYALSYVYVYMNGCIY